MGQDYSSRNNDTADSSMSSGENPSLDGSNSAMQTAMQPRRVAGNGGYVYDQYPDGTIVIASHNGTATNITCQPGTQTNTAITTEIGDYLPSASSDEMQTEHATGDTSSNEGFIAALLATGEDASDNAVGFMGNIVDAMKDTIIDTPASFWGSVFGVDEEADTDAIDSDQSSSWWDSLFGDDKESMDQDGEGDQSSSFFGFSFGGDQESEQDSNGSASMETDTDGVGDYFVVTDANALIRTDPPDLKSTGAKIPLKSRVTIIESITKGRGKYDKVTAAEPDPETGEQQLWGWTSHGNLADGQILERAALIQTSEGVGQTAGRGNSTSSNKNALKQTEESGLSFTPRDLKKKYKDLEGQAYLDAVDAEIGPGGTKKFSDDQQAVIQAARDFASSPQKLNPDQQSNAGISWSNLTLGGVSLNAELKGRLERFQQFIAWAGLVTGPTGKASAMRSPSVAHELSTAWMFSTNNNKSSGLHTAAHRKKLADNLVNYGGTDQDGTTWVSASTVEAVKAAGGDDEQIKALIPQMRKDAGGVRTQNNQAAEGYKETAKRRPNILPGQSVSNHLIGEAVDAFPLWIFPNLFDPLIDAIALHFGLFRACKDLTTPEHWHFERVGAPPISPEAEASTSGE